MDKVEKLMNLLENKYGKKTISEEPKSKIRQIVREEMAGSQNPLKKLMIRKFR